MEDVIDGNCIIEMFHGISDNTRQIILRDLRDQFQTAIEGVNRKCAAENCADISPEPKLILNAFRLCPLERAKIVLLGQDPYINKGQAQGLSFSVPEGFALPPSLKAIYNCMLEQKLIPAMPTHGDLTTWATQGVLMFNVTFTTKLGKSNHHAAIWDDYATSLIKNISTKCPKLIFILLGNNAKVMGKYIDTKKHTILEWGHPSPLNSKNKSDNPEHFKYCPAFREANALLSAPIQWESVCGAAVPQTAPTSVIQFTESPCGVALHGAHTTDCTYIFTDGGATANGTSRCEASWGYCRVSSSETVTSSGKVEKIKIPGCEYSTSNNRGELTAINRALEYISKAPKGKYFIVTDTEYSIKCITIFAANWLKRPADLKTKKNTDLIIPAHKLWLAIKKSGSECQFIHVKSHKKEPADKSSKEWFLWSGNDIADKLCSAELAK